MKGLSLKLSLNFIFIGTVVITCLILGIISHTITRDYAKESSDAFMNELFGQLFGEITAFFDITNNMADMASAYVQRNVIVGQDHERMRLYFYDFIHTHPNYISSGYVGEDGVSIWGYRDIAGYIEKKGNTNNINLSRVATKVSYYSGKTDDPLQVFSIDEDRESLSLVFEQSNYTNPYTFADWYLVASAKGSSTWSEVQILYDDIIGISLLKPIYGSSFEFFGVASIDIEVNFLSRLIKGKVGDKPIDVVIFDDSGNLIAYKDIQALLAKEEGKQEIRSVFSLGNVALNTAINEIATVKDNVIEDTKKNKLYIHHRSYR